MSYDLAVWKQLRPSGRDDPEAMRTFIALAEQGPGVLPGDPSVRAFRMALLRRWPHWVGVVEPNDHDAADPERQVVGGPDADQYVLLTLPYGWLDDETDAELGRLVTEHDLFLFDPQAYDGPDVEQP